MWWSEVCQTSQTPPTAGPANTSKVLQVQITQSEHDYDAATHLAFALWEPQMTPRIEELFSVTFKSSKTLQFPVLQVQHQVVSGGSERSQASAGKKNKTKAEVEVNTENQHLEVQTS